MADVLVSGEIDGSVDDLWRLVADFGAVGWMKGVTGVEVTGEGVGMVRAIFAGGDEAIVEELESLDEAGRQIGYTIKRNNPLPVENYHATCKAVDLGDGRSRLDWACCFDAKGVDEATAKAAVEGMYGVLISWVKEGVERSG